MILFLRVGEVDKSVSLWPLLANIPRECVCAAGSSGLSDSKKKKKMMDKIQSRSKGDF